MNIAEVFKCVMLMPQNEMLSSLPGNTKHVMYKFGQTVLSSVCNTFNGRFTNGYVLDNNNCNWQNINNHLEKVPNDLSILNRECSGNKISIHDIYFDEESNKNMLILQETIFPQNGTVSIFDKTYEANNNIFSLNNITHFLGLNECTAESAKSTLKEYYDYLLSLIPTTASTTTTTKSPLEIFKNSLDSYGISLEQIPYKIGKDILNIFGINTPDTTTTTTTTEASNDETNNGDYTGAYIAAAIVGGIALGTALGYGIKYGIDWYRGKNKAEHDSVEEGKPIVKYDDQKVDELIAIASLMKTLKSRIENDNTQESESEEDGLIENNNTQESQGEGYSLINNDNYEQVLLLLLKKFALPAISIVTTPTIIGLIKQLIELSPDSAPFQDVLVNLKYNLQSQSDSINNNDSKTLDNSYVTVIGEE